MKDAASIPYDGDDAFPLDGKRWTHLNAEVTYAKHDRFKERPQKVKSLTSATIRALREHGLVQSLDPDAQIDESAHRRGHESSRDKEGRYFVG